MKTSERAWRIGRDFAGVPLRARAALRSDGWNPLWPRGIRLLGEVMMDEMALSGMTLAAPPPKLERGETIELLRSDTVAISAVDYQSIEPTAPAHHRLIVGARHDRMAFREPALALHERWGGRLYWHDGGHAGHLFSRRVQAASEQFLRGLSAEGGRRLCG